MLAEVIADYGDIDAGLQLGNGAAVATISVEI
jgi:hypothetical protein